MSVAYDEARAIIGSVALRRTMSEAQVISMRPPPVTQTSLVSPPARWVKPTIERMVELLNLPANWDSYGAARIRPDAAKAMFDVLQDLLTANSLAPTIVPSPHGHLQAEWHVNGVDLELEVMNPTRVDVFFRDGDDVWEEPLSDDLTRLSEITSRLTFPAR